MTDLEERVAEVFWREELRHVRHQSGVHATFASARAAWPMFCERHLEKAREVIAMVRPPRRWWFR